MNETEKLQFVRQEAENLAAPIVDLLRPVVAKGMSGILEQCIEMQEHITALEQQNAELRKALDAKQAKIDALMLEYCPGEMTPEQVAEWGKHQRRVDAVPAAQAPAQQEPNPPRYSYGPGGVMLLNPEDCPRYGDPNSPAAAVSAPRSGPDEAKEKLGSTAQDGESACRE